VHLTGPFSTAELEVKGHPPGFRISVKVCAVVVQSLRLFDLLRSGDTLVVRWVDRLGRNYEDICETIREFMRRGVVIRTVINSITFDGATKDAMQRAVRDALIAFMAATAQAQAEATKEAQRAGIARARANGDLRAYKGRKPSFSRKQYESRRRCWRSPQASARR
jgi:putative DNA-invertase from lambdoid prophage Rac